MHPSRRWPLVVLCAALAASCTGPDSSTDAPAVAASESGVVGVDTSLDTPTGSAVPASTPTTAVDTAAGDSAEAAPERTHRGEVTLRFTDVTDAAGVDLLHESPLDDKEDGRRFMGGAAAGDLDNDGWTDLFVLGGGNRSDALYRNNGDGTFTDVAGEAGVDEPHVGAGVTMADYDGDGWLDMYVTSHGPPEAREPGKHRLWHNNGDGTFTDVAAEADVAWTTSVSADGFGSAFSDYDLDGDLDLFVAGWRRGTESNRLFRNEGDETFVDVTEEVGIVNEGVRGFGPCWTDLDDDLDPDLLLIADFGTTQVYVNENGTFQQVQDDWGLALGDSQAMGTTVADMNNDGLFDWYVTAIHDDDNEGRGLGNLLFMRQPDGTFLEQAVQLGAADGGWGWGAVDVDLDHDGWLDIVEANGWSLPSYENEPSKVFLNRQGSGFEEVASAVGLDHDVDGLSVVRFDMDNDGDQDIAITAANERFSVFRNDLDGAGTGWLRVFLDTTGADGLAPMGWGSTVTVVADGQQQVRALDGCANYLSSNEPSVHFGLGDAEAIDEVVVRWADGTTTTRRGVDINQTLVVAPDE